MLHSKAMHTIFYRSISLGKIQLISMVEEPPLLQRNVLSVQLSLPALPKESYEKSNVNNLKQWPIVVYRPTESQQQPHNNIQEFPIEVYKIECNHCGIVNKIFTTFYAVVEAVQVQIIELLNHFVKILLNLTVLRNI